ncbi:hypothetical protein P3X46_028968 [Hevea brasiliensis]|uniref:Uncharacterized protein n=1 Tax=Hevea brasiliensis TaxID=3981 RepID=A0ABQ9KS76_HEVBR|nr:UDP-glucose iridoid glucosyltransferase [Hevea brasiliensis]KAJ9146737.1 hypothetical protein P3X46_028968 [Hevea brasiliensis]
MEKKGEQRHGRLVVLVPCPFQGHISPMFELGTILYCRGFSITIAHTKFNFPNPANYPNFSFLPIADHLPEHDVASLDIVSLISYLNGNCEAPLLESLSQIMEKPHTKITCIIYDTLMHYSEAVANRLKLTSIILRTSSVATLIAYSKFTQLQQEGYFPLKEHLLQEMVPVLYPLRFKDLPTIDFASLESLMELTNIIIAKRSSAIIWNSMDCLEESELAQHQQQYQVPFFSIGPLYKFATASSSSIIAEDTCCITWLDRKTPNSVIYVSLGSLASMTEKELAEMAWGLANSKQPFLWVIRPNSVCGSEWIELLPKDFKEAVGERGCIVKWAPQKEVLAHPAVEGFWSHCSWNSTLESISEGVPMICRPCFGDQKVNARYVCHVWKVGLELENELEREEVTRAVRRLMVSAEGMEMRQKTIELKEKVESSMKNGGSSYNSLVK